MKVKHRKSLYIAGDYLIQSDLTGRIIRKSESRKLWNNQLCHEDEFEIRNPQDFLRAFPEREPFREVRPRTSEFLTQTVGPDDL